MTEKFDPVACLKNCYGQWHDTKAGCVDEWMAIVDDNIDFKSLAMGRDDNVRFTQPYSGKEQLKGYFDSLCGDWSMIHYTIDEYVAQGDSVCVIGSTAWTNKRTGKSIDTPKVDVWKFRNGKAVSFFEYYDTAAIIAAAAPD